MRAIYLIFFLIFFSFKINAKEIFIGDQKLILPNKFYSISVKNFDIFQSYPDMDEAYFIVDNTIRRILEQYSEGEDLENIQILKPIIKKLSRLENADLNNYGKNFKSFISTIKNTMRKNNVNYIFEYYKANKSVDEYIFKDLDYSMQEIKNMNNKELNKFTKEIKKEITFGNNNFWAINDDLGIVFKNFEIKKNNNQTPYLKIVGKFRYIITDQTINADVVMYLSEHNEKLFMFNGFCMVDCAKLEITFNEIINKSFNNKIYSQSNNQVDDNMIQKLREINDLYKSGVLTEEEFIKLKKKLIN